jgi:glyoxylase-like metal-dependent hydrolase (beta-lactamase superfamily II)
MRRIVATLAAPFLLAPTGAGETFLPGYAWQEVAGGIYLHTRTDPLAGPVDGNSVVIVNDVDVFVVDTHINPAAARAVIARIREITEKPVSHVINTHWHDDHTNGNHAYRQAYPEARIVAHRATLSSLEREWQAMEDQRREVYASVKDQDLMAAAEAADAEDPQRAMGIRLFAAYRDALLPELPGLELVYPDLVFDDSMAFHRGGRRIEVRWMGRGNTDGDVVVWLPDDSVLVTGDMLVAPIPYAFDSPMVDWIGTLGRVAELPAEIIIPGHGPPQRDRAYLKRVVGLLERTVEAVREARAEGVAYEALTDAVDLAAQERQFTRGDPARLFAWRSYFLEPGLKSAWAALGYPVPKGG